MTSALDKNGWLPVCTLAGKIVTRAQLLLQGYSEKEIAENEELLKDDVKRNWLPLEAPGKKALTQWERDLRDPTKDMFVIIFDGQHRSEAVRHSCCAWDGLCGRHRS